MRRTITPVVWGRCRPTPDRVPESASPDRDTRGIVTGHLSTRGGQWFLPVLSTPQAGVGRVDRDNTQALFGGHGDQPGLELPGGHAGDELPEPLAAPVLLARLLGGEIEVLDADRGDTDTPGPADQPGQGMPDLCISVTGRTGQVVEEPVRVTDRVAVPVEQVGSEVVRMRSGTSGLAPRGGGCGRPPPGWLRCGRPTPHPDARTPRWRRGRTGRAWRWPGARAGREA